MSVKMICIRAPRFLSGFLRLFGAQTQIDGVGAQGVRPLLGARLKDESDQRTKENRRRNTACRCG